MANSTLDSTVSTSTPALISADHAPIYITVGAGETKFVDLQPGETYRVALQHKTRTFSDSELDVVAKKFNTDLVVLLASHSAVIFTDYFETCDTTANACTVSLPADKGEYIVAIEQPKNALLFEDGSHLVYFHGSRESVIDIADQDSQLGGLLYDFYDPSLADVSGDSVDCATTQTNSEINTAKDTQAAFTDEEGCRVSRVKESGTSAIKTERELEIEADKRFNQSIKDSVEDNPTFQNNDADGTNFSDAAALLNAIAPIEIDLSAVELNNTAQIQTAVNPVNSAGFDGATYLPENTENVVDAMTGIVLV